MEVTRIINERPAQTYTKEWVNNNQDKLINGDFVKNWTLAPKYDKNFLLPKWDGGNYYEAATTEEIEEANKPIIPEVVSRRQFKIALAVLGYNEQDILNGINQLPEPNKTIARISYTESGTFERNSDDLIFVAKTFLQLTDEQIDEVFLTAQTF